MTKILFKSEFLPNQSNYYFDCDSDNISFYI